jgi:hypothetical protein
MTEKELSFEKFWALWPQNKAGGYQRKGGKAMCLKTWIKRHHDTQADTIYKHVEWLKTTADWLKDGGAFIPMPITYLNQQRWDGADIPELPKPKDNEFLQSFEAHRAKSVPMPAHLQKRVKTILESAK